MERYLVIIQEDAECGGAVHLASGHGATKESATAAAQVELAAGIADESIVVYDMGEIYTDVHHMKWEVGP